MTYHPAYLLRTLPDKAKAWEDLVFARAVIEQNAGAVKQNCLVSSHSKFAQPLLAVLHSAIGQPLRCAVMHQHQPAQ